ncbi:hypothetical protein [Microbacterium thalassium]|uniref:Protein-tyrosine phosphatase n=1 Tax=Microbacterium thalassium TaxID=362649 RepID=A0A7X0KT91_9MICO|nr:hypothetical protein [Microbacterium thalassium]MBB6389881.1 protein-tyrosine phosphatase [Microbacterium thalassium]GLK24568.1 low molecular weight phosphatase family protein [Microbacterium thalassium]
MMPAFSILTVCRGNIHRSPLAACLLETWAGWYLPAAVSESVSVRSAGLTAPVGEPMGRRVQKVVRALGADGSHHRATQITEDLIASSDLILVASRSQQQQVLSYVPAALRRTFTLREAGRIAATLPVPSPPHAPSDLVAMVSAMADHRTAPMNPADDDVLDPQGEGDDAYQQMVREEVPAVVALARTLLRMPRGDVEAYLAAAEDPASLLTDGEADPQ